MHLYLKLRSTLSSWKINRVSATSRAINIVWLILAWAFLPLEREPWGRFRARWTCLYPQINPQAPRACDAIRFVIQSLYLIFYRAPKTPSRLWGVMTSFMHGTRAVFSRLGQWIGHYGAMLLEGKQRGLEKIGNEEIALSPVIFNTIAWMLGAVAVGLAVLCITQPFNVQGQVLFLSVMLILALMLTQIKARITLMLLFVISMVVSGRYLWWRCTATVNTDSVLGLILSLLLLLAEIYAFIVMLLGYFQVCWVLDRKVYPLPDDQMLWPHIDIYIPTYNESLDVIKPTVFAATNLQWPADKLHIYVLDDGSRDFVESFAVQAGVGYIRRTEHNHAKAGNINHAMGKTSGEFITIFDCDHVPSSDFLLKTVGWLVKDAKIALVQTPHHFYSPDPFEKNWHLDRRIPIENALFHDFIQKGNDTWNATMFCGSSAVIRRSALEEIGGIAVETVTEDAHTSLKLNRLGYSSAFIDEPLASGLSTDTLAAHIGQRIRWARGMIQIFRLDNPLFGKGLILAQRLCFLNAMIHFLHGLPRLIFLVAPLPYMFANVYVIYATVAAIFAYVIPHMVHSTLTNHQLQRGFRFPFLGAVYETVLSWYILLPTTVALLMPHKGKFNVTAKGAVIGQKYLDWTISRPYWILIALNMAGLAVGFYKGFFDPDPEYVTLAINMGWIVYNLMILGAAMGCAVEEVQEHAFARISCAIDVTLHDKKEKRSAKMVEFSQTEIRLADVHEAEVGEVLLMTFEGQLHRFKAEVFKVEGDAVEARLIFTTVKEERLFNRYTFARAALWAQKPEEAVDDRLTAGWVMLVRLAGYGFKSMVEFLPRRLSFIRRGLVWLLTLLPCKVAD